MGKREIKDHFELISENYDKWKSMNRYYHSTLKDFYRSHTKPTDDVVEYGCGTGDILSAVNGRRKVGLDIAEGMLRRAKEKYPNLEFYQHDAETAFQARAAFDVALLPDIIDHVTDILKLYGSVNRILKMGGRMCLSTINPLWDPIFLVAEKMGQKMPEGEHNFVPNRDLINFLALRGFKLSSWGSRMLIPRYIPLISDPINALAPRLPFVRRLCVAQTLVAEKVREYPDAYEGDLTCSVVIPCFNEAGNIEECIRRIPSMGRKTEILVVDDGSRDETASIARKIAETDPRVRVISYSPNQGKAQAVKKGFDHATGDVMMILDADMTVMPEELPEFFRPLAEGVADFANGTRMIYPMEQQAMRFLNVVGNFVFGIVMSWLTAQRISDTLCGTKALFRKEYSKIPLGRDRWGDFDLLFGAAENHLRIVEVPVHYKARVAGVSKMQPFRHALLLVRMCWRGFLRLKLGIKRS